MSLTSIIPNLTGHTKPQRPLTPPSPSPSLSLSMESTTVETSDGVKLHVRLFNPQSDVDDPKPNTVIVLVHPFTLLGGSQGLLRGIAMGLAERGFKAVTFDTRGAGRSSGRASLTGFSEIQDVVAVCKWVKENLNPDGIVLVGSSAGKKFQSVIFVVYFD